VPDAVNLAVAQHAKDHGVAVALDLGGDDTPPSKDLLACVDFCWPNETEVRARVLGMACACTVKKVILNDTKSQSYEIAG